MKISDKTPIRYYDRKGNPLKNAMEWADKIDDLDYVTVKKDFIQNYIISTVWLGLNHNLWHRHELHIFETMIFYKLDNVPEPVDPLDLDCQYHERYSSEELALLGHEAAIQHVKKLLNYQ